MKTLLLLRHAKAAAGDGKIQDKDRPLNETGRDTCRLMGRYIRKAGFRPQQVLCSPSLRTRETYGRVFEAAGFLPPAQYPDSLYLAATGGMLRLVHNAPDDIESLMLIGHNPGIHNLALKLAKEGPDHYIHLLEEKFPTCALAVLACETPSWKALALQSAALTHFITPKTADDR